MSEAKFKGEYGKSDAGNFEVIDIIGVPHPFVIGAKHVAMAADHFGGRLGEAAIEAAEKRGVGCQWNGCQLTYKQHEHALMVSCKAELNGSDGKVNPELHAYLLRIKDECEKNGYAGFAFIEAKRVQS